MSTDTSFRPRTAARRDVRLVREVVVVALSVDDIEPWLRDHEPALRSLAERARPSAVDLAALHHALARLDRTVAVLDRLTLEAEPGHADLDTVGWLHTRSSALADALTAAVERVALDRAA